MADQNTSEEIEDDVEDAAEGTPEEQDDTEEAAEPEEGAEEETEEGEETEGKAAAADEVPAKRGENRIAKLARERNELREKLARAEAIAEERGRTTTQPANTEAARREREEKLALMDPQERREFQMQEQIDTMHKQVLLTQLQTQDSIDKSNFLLVARSNPVFAKHAPEVERRLAQERQQGRNWNREQVLAFIVGEAALKAKPNTKEKEKARERVESVKGTPTRGRSNTTSYRPGRAGESLEELERRLESVNF